MGAILQVPKSHLKLGQSGRFSLDNKQLEFDSDTKVVWVWDATNIGVTLQTLKVNIRASSAIAHGADLLFTLYFCITHSQKQKETSYESRFYSRISC
jgi:hypothetical protein